ncbi:MAG: hypothetical protein R2744_05110 [Bacteroidales bacterium]
MIQRIFPDRFNCISPVCSPYYGCSCLVDKLFEIEIVRLNIFCYKDGGTFKVRDIVVVCCGRELSLLSSIIPSTSK